MILKILTVLAISFLVVRVGMSSSKRKRIRRQYGVPYANNIHDLAERARRKAGRQ